ncbi:CocE/NonD family hydrolase [Nocardia vinacea]|uniref:CocE/NonD family hydrolase n=1 Tax=Nocardia vinacea TaxID=96468 RepID=UPI0005942442|nr:CocE/NonD family hydrolase [Nocardia vinacea]
MKFEQDVMVPMRDGVMLATDIWLPHDGPAPVLLMRDPYVKDTGGAIRSSGFLVLYLPHVLAAGYAVVIQDCRGTGNSEGTYIPMIDEPNDGADTIDWIHEQPWSNGKIGMFGLSYHGMVQWAAATVANERLTAIAPTLATSDYYHTPWYSPGGAMSWHCVFFWTSMMAAVDANRSLAAGSGSSENAMALAEMHVALDKYLDTTPLTAVPLLGECTTWWSDLLQHPARDSFWQERAAAERFEDVTAPALNIGGWFDMFIDSTVSSYQGMRKRGGSVEARDGQRLIIGPWDHRQYSGMNIDRTFGPMADAAAADIIGYQMKFFDRWLRGNTDAFDDTYPVRIFVMGIDQWRDELDWPLPDTEYRDYYLDSSGRANTALGDGLLSVDTPLLAAADTFLYDPRRPVPTIGGRTLMPSAGGGSGPVDQRPIHSREDVLCYATPVLDEPLEVTGNISLTVFVTSSAKDTDFTGKLVDIHPDGRAIYLTDGILRARYRKSLSEPELMVPGEVYEITLDMSVTSNVFLPGHKILLEVSSSNFPRYDRNSNTGGVIAEESLDDSVIAVNNILHGPDYPSRLTLPVIDRRLS